MRKISIEDIVRLVIVVCSNRFGLHDEVYVRYVILVNHHDEAYWVDDPTEEEVEKLVHGVSKTCNMQALTAPCPFCQAVSPLDS